MLDVRHWFEKRWKKALETMAKHYLELAAVILALETMAKYYLELVAVILDILKMYIIGILLYK